MQVKFDVSLQIVDEDNTIISDFKDEFKSTFNDDFSLEDAIQYINSTYDKVTERLDIAQGLCEG